MRRFKNILCVIEPGNTSQILLERAVALAENNQADLMVVDVVPRVSDRSAMSAGDSLYRDLQTALESEHEARIVSLVEPYRKRINIRHKVLPGASFLELIREVLVNGFDLVIKCPESPDWLDRFFSGDDMHLLRKCPCPVWIVKPYTSRPYERILATVDLDDFYPSQELAARHELNAQILEVAASMAIAEFAELHIVYVWKPLSELVSGLGFSSNIPVDRLAARIEQERREQQQLVDDFMRKMSTHFDGVRDALDHLRPRTHLLEGAARKEVPALAKQLQVDCIVMGTVGRTGVRGFFMGNTAETILEQINCSVLAIKPPGFVTPVAVEA